MGKITGATKLLALMTGMGAAAQVLRRLLYLLAVDEKGLLLRGHPLSVALLVLTAAAALLAALWARRQKDSEAVEGSVFSGLFAGLGHVALAAGILLATLTGISPTMSYLDTVWRWLGYGAPVCLLAAGVAAVLRRKPFFLLHVVPCLFFVVHIVCQYQTWSGNPQMQDYVFALMGAMTLMLTIFYAAAREAGCGNPRMELGMGMAALYLCLAELGHSAYPVLYLGGALWVLTNLPGCLPQPTWEKE